MPDRSKQSGLKRWVGSKPKAAPHCMDAAVLRLDIYRGQMRAAEHPPQAERAGQDLGAGVGAAGAALLGGLVALPGGECAPDASIGLASGGV